MIGSSGVLQTQEPQVNFRTDQHSQLRNAHIDAQAVAAADPFVASPRSHHDLLNQPRSMALELSPAAQGRPWFGPMIFNQHLAPPNRIVTENHDLVIEIATRFEGRGIPLNELIEEGTIGLLLAAQDFDPARGTRFSTCASWWIKQSIKRAIRYALRPVSLVT